MMRPSARRVRLVARTELRRTWRNLRDSTRGVVMLLGGGLMIPLYSLGMGALAYFGGSALAETDIRQLRSAALSVLAMLLALVVFVELQRSAKQVGEPDGLDGLLTTIPYVDVLAGVLTAEFVRILGALGLPLLAFAVGLTVGAGHPLVFPAVLLTTLLVTALGALLGYAGGLTVKLAAARSAFVARHRASVGSLASMGLVVGWIGLSTVSSVQRSVLRAVTRSPLAWLGDIVLVALPDVPASPLAAAGGWALLLGSVVAAAVGTRWLARAVWYVDPVQPDHEFDADERTLSDRLLTGRVSTATRVVAQKSWLRAKRSPFTVQFAVAPLFLLVYQGQFLLTGGPVPATLPLTAGLASASAFGAAFTLNPLGGEERVLPLTLTANVSGREFLAGLVIAGVLPGLPVTMTLVGGLGVVAGLGPAALGTALATAFVATLAAPAVAAGTGVVFPKFETSSVHGREVTVPSSWAFLSYFALLAVAVLPASAAFLFAVDPPFSVPFPVGTPVSLGIGLGVTVVLLGAIGGLGYRYAANRVATYRLP
ncbi:hypothetical protein KTS45_07270 [Halomicroarcula limicola]|uniref:Uncharacterized protein n=1 Tax=Haloarcula limicola TaxID=1429915 RepID=A0A8J7Y4E3_9EURY|nr:hypothetical protein [Halomicroarcula limicola]MBV0924002.1 hypothetical protein [Halomicroarcula limicola]